MVTVDNSSEVCKRGVEFKLLNYKKFRHILAAIAIIEQINFLSKSLILKMVRL